jgi:hypothetical protein
LSARRRPKYARLVARLPICFKCGEQLVPNDSTGAHHVAPGRVSGAAGRAFRCMTRGCTQWGKQIYD